MDILGNVLGVSMSCLPAFNRYSEDNKKRSEGLYFLLSSALHEVHMILRSDTGIQNQSYVLCPRL